MKAVPATALLATVAAATPAAPAGAADAAPQESAVATHAVAAASHRLGAAGTAAGLWESYEVFNGFAGYVLVVRHEPAAGLRDAWTYVYTAPHGRECADVGGAGADRRVWLRYRCTDDHRGQRLYVR